MVSKGAETKLIGTINRGRFLKNFDLSLYILIDYVKGLFSDQRIHSALNISPFFALQPLLPVVGCLPLAYNHDIFGIIKAS